MYDNMWLPFSTGIVVIMMVVLVVVDAGVVVLIVVVGIRNNNNITVGGCLGFPKWMHTTFSFKIHFVHFLFFMIVCIRSWAERDQCLKSSSIPNK